MAIDDPLDAFEQQNMRDEPQLPGKLAKFAADIGTKLAFPESGLALDILIKVADVLFNKEAAINENIEMWNCIKDEFRHIEKTKCNHDDVQKAIQLAFTYNRHERDKKKRDRYVTLIGNAVRSEEQIQDVASFIQTIEQLNERDLIVLKVLNRTMNQDGDWKLQVGTPPGLNNVMKLHPQTLIARAQELTVQIAQALGRSTDGNQYTREEGYGICNRLAGFGLAHEINVQPRELPLTNYCFRLSVQGMQLLRLLGENVPNYENYLR